jgi:predicted nucleic acid-binding protein
MLDRNDVWHKACVDLYPTLDAPLLTTEAVLTEVFHLAGRARVEMEIAWGFLRSGAVVLGAIQNSELPEIHSLMTRYADRPMDFADATLVYLAKREKLSTIFTVDRDDFAIYRIEGKRPFRILPTARS